MAQHVAREVAHVARQHVVAPAQQRERAAGVDEVDRPARAGAELDPALLAALARRRRQRDGVLHHAPVDVDRLRRALVAASAAGESTSRAARAAVERALDHGDLVARVGVVDDELEHEAVDLRLGQRVGALGLDRVLRRQHEERLRARVCVSCPIVTWRSCITSSSADCTFGGRAVDLVGEQEVAEHRAELGVEAARVRPVDARADEVGRHEVGSELEPLERAAEHVGDAS